MVNDLLQYCISSRQSVTACGSCLPLQSSLVSSSSSDGPGDFGPHTTSSVTPHSPYSESPNLVPMPRACMLTERHSSVGLFVQSSGRLRSSLPTLSSLGTSSAVSVNSIVGSTHDHVCILVLTCLSTLLIDDAAPQTPQSFSVVYIWAMRLGI